MVIEAGSDIAGNGQGAEDRWGVPAAEPAKDDVVTKAVSHAVELVGDMGMLDNPPDKRRFSTASTIVAFGRSAARRAGGGKWRPRRAAPWVVPPRYPVAG